ncbi:MAG TPA: hypothetical protein PLP42_04110 [Acidobacteriota bacterium]|nr:hypothetical protein [Acidobacteriota bacterium]
MKKQIVCAGMALAIVGLGGFALAGPPLVCFPFETGAEPSLPWGGIAWHDSSPTYDTSRLAADTISLLGNDVSVLARMETLRRAGIYSAKDPKAGAELLELLRTRVRNGGDQETLTYALFDLGYFAETYRQASRGYKRPDPHQIEGYTLVSKALVSRPNDPEMHFAAAVMTLGSKFEKEHEHHFEQAARRAQEGSLLARNLVSHFQWRGKDLQTLRASAR